MFLYIFKHPFILNARHDKRCVLQLIEEKNAKYKQIRNSLNYIKSASVSNLKSGSISNLKIDSISNLKTGSIANLKSTSVSNLNRINQKVSSLESLNKKLAPNPLPNRETVQYEHPNDNLNDSLKRISKQLVKEICDEVIKSEYEIPSIPYIIYETIKEILVEIKKE
jgi:hypothetical protein